ncbi:MAG TPA: phosphotransferase [Smithellaceae bacterium]|nr:phosphotransferase [Smithellaceae bacterium]
MNKETVNFLNANLGKADWLMIPIKKGGSDRSFFRVSAAGQKSFILMQYGVEKDENYCWLDIAGFLRGINVTVPGIFASDKKQRLVLMEDLGDVDLWSMRDKPWSKRRGCYQEVLAIIAKLHLLPLVSLPADLKLMEGYGPTLYRWEQNYFLENFVGAVCKMELPDDFRYSLQDELNALTGRLLRVSPCLIHRDFQSQNIMIKNGKPVLVDFQGMREGLFFYDLGSLLYDPYVYLTPDEIDELLDFYYLLNNGGYGKEEFISVFYDATAQRLMQALGAYGFLGLKKNKPDFLKHIKRGRENLLAATSGSPRLLRLHELAKSAEPAKI